MKAVARGGRSLGAESDCENQVEATETAQVRTVHLQLVQLWDSRTFSWLLLLVRASINSVVVSLSFVCK